MKKGIAFFAAVCILLFLAACGDNQEAVDDAYQRGYNAGYSSGYADGVGEGYQEAKDDYLAVLSDVYDRISGVTAMLEEFDLYEIDDIYDALISIEQYIGKHI